MPVVQKIAVKNLLDSKQLNPHSASSHTRSVSEASFLVFSPLHSLLFWKFPVFDVRLFSPALSFYIFSNFIFQVIADKLMPWWSACLSLHNLNIYYFFWSIGQILTDTHWSL